MKRALVTGGTKGIGKAVVEALEAQGHFVMALSREPNGFVNSDVKQWIRCDVLDAEQVRQAKLYLNTHRVDILVNNVGGGGRWGEVDGLNQPTIFRDVYQKNAGAAVEFTRMCIPFMLAGGWGRVVTIASIHGKEAGGKPWFNMAKSAEISFMKSLSRDKELVRRNITFNTVCPGHISVPGKPDEKNLEDFPLGRMGRAEEVASVVAFLCSDAASLVNGACIAVDGGESRSF